MPYNDDHQGTRWGFMPKAGTLGRTRHIECESSSGPGEGTLRPQVPPCRRPSAAMAEELLPQGMEGANCLHCTTSGANFFWILALAVRSES